MIAFFTAVYEHATGSTNDFGTAISNSLHYGHAQDNPTGSYAVVSGLPEVPADTFDATINDGEIQFNCFADDFETCMDVAEKCLARYDKATLEVSGHYDVRLFRELVTPPFKADTEPKTEWQAVVTFRYMIQKI